MNIKDILNSLNEKLKAGQVQDVKNDFVISEISNGNLKIITVIESLGEVLVNEDKVIRERGVDYLSWILNQIPTNLLNGKEISVMVNFYCDRLKDHHSLIPATVSGLLASVKMKEIKKESIIQMLTQLFQHVNCRTQLQEDRYNIYCIFRHIIEFHLDNIRIMGPDFVFGIISFIDGETDPKNLLLLFELLPIFLKNFELGHLVEEMFEILSCYFPIDFNSAARNNVVITRDDLSNGLIRCLSSTRAFSEFCVPLIIEKLDSTLKTAKLDSYRLLQNCCSVYHVEDFEKHLNELWKLIQKDLLPGNDSQIRKEGLKAVTCIVKSLSSKEVPNETLTNFLNDILTTLMSSVNKVEDNLFVPAINILVAAAKESEPAGKHIVYFLKPYYQLNFTNTPSERRIILSSLLPFLKFCFTNKENNTVVVENFPHISELIELYINSTSANDPEVRKLSFCGLQILIPGLDDLNRKRLYPIIIGEIKKEENEDARNECLNAFRLLAEHYHLEITEVINTYFQVNVNAFDGELEISRYLHALSKIADLPKFTNLVIPLLLNIIFNSSNYSNALSCLLDICKSNYHSKEFLKKINKDYNIVKKLTEWFLGKVDENSLVMNQTLCHVSEVVAILVRVQEAEVQQLICDKFLPTFVNVLSVQNDHSSLNNSKSASVAKLLEVILGSVRAEVSVHSLPIIISCLTSISLKSDNDIVARSASRLLASILNKSPEKDANELLAEVTNRIFENINSDSTSIGIKVKSANLLNWIMKGIILRGYSNLEEWTMKWFDLLSREDIGTFIAEGLGIVIAEDDLLNLDSHCTVKILYRQRLFTYLPKLVSTYQTVKDEVKVNYLLALTHLMKGVPKHILLTEISSVAILLVHSLDSKESQILLLSLDVLSSLLEEKEEIFSHHIQSFIEKLLNLSKFKDSMKIRIDALKCLFFYAFYPTVFLLPYKSKVLKELESCLDDKKRLVRSEAVKARSRWYLVGAPGEDDIFSG